MLNNILTFVRRNKIRNSKKNRVATNKSPIFVWGVIMRIDDLQFLPIFDFVSIADGIEEREMKKKMFCFFRIQGN